MFSKAALRKMIVVVRAKHESFGSIDAAHFPKTGRALLNLKTWSTQSLGDCLTQIWGAPREMNTLIDEKLGAGPTRPNFGTTEYLNTLTR